MNELVKNYFKLLKYIIQDYSQTEKFTKLSYIIMFPIR